MGVFIKEIKWKYCMHHYILSEFVPLAQYTMACFSCSCFGELKNKPIKENEERKIPPRIHSFNIILSYSHFFSFFSFSITSSFLVLCSENSNGCSCRWEVVICLLARAKMTSGVGGNIQAMWKIEENWRYDYEEHMCAQHYIFLV